MLFIKKIFLFIRDPFEGCVDSRTDQRKAEESTVRMITGPQGRSPSAKEGERGGQTNGTSVWNDASLTARRPSPRPWAARSETLSDPRLPPRSASPRSRLSWPPGTSPGDGETEAGVGPAIFMSASGRVAGDARLGLGRLGGWALGRVPTARESRVWDPRARLSGPGAQASGQTVRRGPSGRATGARVQPQPAPVLPTSRAPALPRPPGAARRGLPA